MIILILFLFAIKYLLVSNAPSSLPNQWINGTNYFNHSPLTASLSQSFANLVPIATILFSLIIEIDSS